MTMTETITLSTQYDPKLTETKWQEYWEDNAVFQANPKAEGKPYCIVIPPPNVTGNLHMGHAFNTSLIDTLIRYHRMKGDNTLCLPGTDHASIAVQTILEKQLKAEGKTRNDLGREDFLDRAWQWKQQSGSTIVNQLRHLGLSADWSRERFTLDESLCHAVKTAFVKLYEEGLIYRGQYLVNWCPASQSAVSDLEVENQEVDGNLWHFRYPLIDGSGFIEIATTRPETMLGDSAVAVNPKDPRYQTLIGKTLRLPIIGREIPIVGDEWVDLEFGTGCVKVTPAHDPNDFEIGKRHNLPFINILNKDGTINENGAEFTGQDRFVARKNVVKRLEEEGLLVKVENYRHSVPFSDRGKVPVEPLLSTQWYVKIEPLAQKALKELDENHSPAYIPERWAKVYRDWLVKLKDWCISRQLWWGHQIPAWYVVSETNNEITDHTPFVVAYNELEAKEKAQAKYGHDIILTQDPDVLDTWFSSGLWPFSTLGWPNETDDLATYYPNATMVTGFDIIFFWVARMTMMAGHFTNKMPFKDVYIHGLVRDEKGKKMSKSANNGIDPLLLTEKYGADALRYTLIREVAGAGQDISLQFDRQKQESASVEASRNFANKLWNASRFVMMNLDGKTPQELGTPNLHNLELSDQWILSRFTQIVQNSRQQLEQYNLGEAAKALYEFIWGDFCDWYIELVKPRFRENNQSRLLAQQTLAYVLDGILKLLHPFMPHITEEIWQTLTRQTNTCLAVQTYPVVDELLATIANLPVEEKPSVMVVTETVMQPPVITAKETPAINKEDPSLLQSIIGKIDLLPSSIAYFIKSYQQGLLTLGLLAVAVVTLQAVSALLTAIHHVPIVEPTLQLIGLGYSLWFVTRYLLWANNREELWAVLEDFKAEIVGKFDQTPLPATTVETATESIIETKESLTLPTSLINSQLEDQFEVLMNTIRVIRNLRAEVDIKPGLKVPIMLQSDESTIRSILAQGESYIKELGKVDSLTLTDKLPESMSQCIVGVVGTIQVLLPLTGLIDISALKAKLEKKIGKLEGEINSLTARLNNPAFIQKANPDVIQNTQNLLTEAEKQKAILLERLQQLQ